MQDRGGVDDRLVGESEGTLEGSRRRWKDNVKLVFEETCEGVDSICLGHLIKILLPLNVRFS